MDYTKAEVLRFVEENDVKFVKLAFCDIFGRLKNLNLFAEELKKAFDRGMPFNAHGVDGFAALEQDELYLKPVSGTLNVLPWRPHEGCVARLLCDIVKFDGTPFGGDARNLLKSAVAELKALGYTCDISSSCEFYLFKTDESGEPTDIPQDRAGYLDASPLDRGENVRRDICLTLEEMEIIPRTSHHERGPGQNEIDFCKNDALSAADDMNTFKYVVKAIAERNGLYASFMPKPLAEHPGSGLHLGFMLNKNGKNITKNADGGLSDEARHFMFGILKHIREISLFSNPLANSYERFGSGEAPKQISFSQDCGSALIRISQSAGEDAKFVLRSPDPACNQYLTFALLIYAGIDGLKNNYTEKDLEPNTTLPDSLGDAIAIVRQGSFVQSLVDREIIDSYISAKTAEWQSYSSDRGAEIRKSFLIH